MCYLGLLRSTFGRRFGSFLEAWGSKSVIWGDLGDRLKFRWILVPPLGGPKLRGPGHGVVKWESRATLQPPTDRLVESGYSIQDTT